MTDYVSATEVKPEQQECDEEVMRVFEMARDGIVELVASMGLHYAVEHPEANISEFTLVLIENIRSIGVDDDEDISEEAFKAKLDALNISKEVSDNE